MYEQREASPFTVPGGYSPQPPTYELFSAMMGNVAHKTLLSEDGLLWVTKGKKIKADEKPRKKQSFR